MANSKHDNESGALIFMGETGAFGKRPQDKRSKPYLWDDSRFNNPLAPVVGVNYYEAEAYCVWLSNVLHRKIRLPAKEEWERTARGVNGRDYPWGNTFDRNRLNCQEYWHENSRLDWDNWMVSDKSTTTVVVQFIEAISESGVCDLAGNVTEWTSSWQEKRLHYAAYGGAWNDCCGRFNHQPNNVVLLDSMGFRVSTPGATEDFVGWVSTDASRNRSA